MMRQKILEGYQSLQNQITQIQNALEQMPEGKLLFSKSLKYVRWYVSDGHKKVYIPKKNRHLAEQLAAKKYLNLKLDALVHEKNALESYLKLYSEEDQRADALLEEKSDYFELLSPYFRTKNVELAQWMDEPYERNPKYPEHLIHGTSSGIFVRSKSESMIEHFLHTNQIPFRYECVLRLDGRVLYPDFTIRHPETGKVYYWEHFGLMDDETYAHHACSKLELYANHGIVPSVQLITTFETKKNPLNYQDVARVGEFYFLR